MKWNAILIQDVRCQIFPTSFTLFEFPWSSVAFFLAQWVKNPPAMQETEVQSLGGEYPLEKGMATYSSILAWRTGRIAMTNLESILKSKDITLSTKVHLVKAMIFPGVMYGCENRTIQKAECWKIDAFELWCWRRLLRVPWIARRSNQSILKEISPEYSLEGLMLKLKL